MNKQRRLGQLGIWLTLGLIGISLLALPSWSQSSDTGGQLGDGTASGIVLSEPNAGVNRLLPGPLSVTAAEVTIAPIYLDGRTLFYVSAPEVDGQQPAEERAQEIQSRLNKIARSQTEPLETQVKIDEPSNLPVVVAGDQTLLTITQLDAQIAGYANASDRAQAIAADLQIALQSYITERQPDFWQRQAKVAAGILFGALLLQLVLNRISLRVKRRQARLVSLETQLGKPRSQPYSPLVEAISSGNFNTVFDQVKARLDNRQKRKLNELLKVLVVFAQVSLWVGALLWLLALFPYSRWLATLSLLWVQVPGRILLALGVGYAAIRLSSFAIDKTILTLQEGTHWAPERSRRRSLRFSTFSQVAKGVAGSIIFSIVALKILAIAGVEVGPLLAGAGIIGVGISLAAQSLIKDFINGFFILFEDQFGIGDVITIGNLAGSVESLNLRITQLRDSEGRLITIPNSQISIVQNASKDWAQVDLSIRVAPSADLVKAIALVKETAITLSEDAQWQRSILEPPDILGVESLDHTGVAIRLFMKTQPLQQWPVARELRARIKQAFDAAEIAMGVPQERIEIRLSDRTVSTLENRHTQDRATATTTTTTAAAESPLPETPT
ncbi:MAG: mechanosensitive ion channel family protein [Phormidesmis sp.]